MDSFLHRTVKTQTADETRALGEKLAARLEPGTVVFLFGELGTGKTCLVKGLASGLGLDPATVNSPSFTRIQVHHGRLLLYHIDLYRLEPGEDFRDLSLDEIFAGPGIAVVEWAERLPPEAKPVPRLEIHLRYTADEKRELTFQMVDAPSEMI